jgi:hypothetical protein
MSASAYTTVGGPPVALHPLDHPLDLPLHGLGAHEDVVEHILDVALGAGLPLRADRALDGHELLLQLGPPHVEGPFDLLTGELLVVVQQAVERLDQSLAVDGVDLGRLQVGERAGEVGRARPDEQRGDARGLQVASEDAGFEGQPRRALVGR